MKKTVKAKASVILMSLAMIFTIMPMMAAVAHADSTEDAVDHIKYTLDDYDLTASVTGVDREFPSEITIPVTIEIDGTTYQVTSIENSAFEGRKHLTSITIPSSVTSIGEDAFIDCESLTSVTFESESRLTDIEHRAFQGCKSLTDITIPDGVTSIKSSTFDGCESLTGVTIPGSVTSIGGNAFNRCGSLTNIMIPNSVNSIDDRAFFGSGLTSITFESESSLRSIEDNAFNNCVWLTSVTIPDSVTSIGAGAFRGCYTLTSVTIPKSVTRIDTLAFSACPDLDTVVFCGSEAEWNQMNRHPDWAGSQEIQVVFLIVKVPEGKTLTYNGEEQTGVPAGTGYTLSDTASATNAGSYQTTATLKEGFQWEDGTCESRTISWVINKAASEIAVPTGKTLTYDGSEQTGVEEGTGYTLTGASATNAGSYTATATLKEDPNYVYEWADGTTDPKTIEWTINKATIEVPESKTLTYNGEVQTGVAVATGYTLSGMASATDAGSYQTTATLEEGYIWADGSEAPRTIEWTINKVTAKVTVPTGKAFTYNGKEKVFGSSGSYYTLTGTTKATKTGTYTAKATLKTNANYTYIWMDGTTAVKAIKWTINKAANTFRIKGRTATIKYRAVKKKSQVLGVTKAISFANNGQGAKTYVKVGGNKKITVAKATGNVTVKKGLKKGTYKVRVRVKAAGNANFKASAWKTVTFRVKVK